MEALVILGLDSGATPRQVRRAYRRLALRYHPDCNRDAASGAFKVWCQTRFRDVTGAYAVLAAGFDDQDESEHYGDCRRCGDWESLGVGLDGNAYCRTCLLEAAGKRALPAPPAVMVRLTATTVGLGVSAVALAEYVLGGGGIFGWISVGSSLAAMVVLAAVCLKVQWTSPQGSGRAARAKPSRRRFRWRHRLPGFRRSGHIPVCPPS